MIEDDVMIIYVGVYIGNGEMAVVYDCDVAKESESMCVIGEVLSFSTKIIIPPK